MLRYGTTGHSMVPNGVIGDLYVQFPFQQKKNLLNSYTRSASTTTFGQGGPRGGALSWLPPDHQSHKFAYNITQTHRIAHVSIYMFRYEPCKLVYLLI